MGKVLGIGQHESVTPVWVRCKAWGNTRIQHQFCKVFRLCVSIGKDCRDVIRLVFKARQGTTNHRLDMSLEALEKIKKLMPQMS